MSKCRYDLTEDCNNTDCLKCVFDKIRAEIEQGYCEITDDYDKGRNMGLRIATQIIDKYRAESEAQE